MSDGMNPWISQPAPAQPGPSAAVPAPSGVPSRPTAPQGGIPAPDRVDQLPVYPRTTAAALWFVGVHGGAGESTLAALSPSWAAADHGWPSTAGSTPAVALVARTSAHGLRAAQAASTQWAAGLVPHVQLLGLVLIADAPGRFPKALRDLAHVVSGGVPRVWTVPWLEPLRLGDSLTLAQYPREVHRLVDELSSLTSSTSPTLNRKERR